MKKIFFFFFLSLLSYAADLNLLLNKIEKNEDLSNITKQESGGISYVITRYQLDMMQAHYLRDILQNTIIGYNESRYNVLDPWSAPFMPYSSVGLRIFIDDQEIGSAKYDNGVYLFGNINLDFVDHIEIYYMTPNYKDGIEPSFVILKLYTKNPKRDEGKKIAFLHSSTKSNSILFQNGFFNKKYSCFINLSKNNINHKNYFIKNKFISRDSNNFHFLNTIHFKHSQLLINMINKKQNDFMGISLNGAPDVSKSNIKELHIGYVYKKNIELKYSFDYTHIHSKFAEYDEPLYFKKINGKYYPVYFLEEKDYGIANTISANKYIKFKNYDGWVGFDIRNKKIDFPLIKINNQKSKYNSIKNQRMLSFFTENRYQINKKNIFSFAYKGTKYFNIKYKDYFLINYKFGDTWVFDRNNIFKVFYYHFEYPMPLYFYSFILTNNIKLNPQKGNALVFKYKKNINKNNKIQFVYFTGKTKNYPYFVNYASVYDSYIAIKLLNLKYKFIYNEINNLIFDFSRIIFSKNSPVNYDTKISFLHTHRYKKFELFENYIFRKTNYNNSVSVIRNLDLGLKYNLNDNLTFSLKGKNLLRRGYTKKFVIYDYKKDIFSNYPIELQEKKIILGLEYLF